MTKHKNSHTPVKNPVEDKLNFLSPEVVIITKRELCTSIDKHRKKSKFIELNELNEFNEFNENDHFVVKQLFQEDDLLLGDVAAPPA